jgi:hypothetical protein
MAWCLVLHLQQTIYTIFSPEIFSVLGHLNKTLKEALKCRRLHDWFYQHTTEFYDKGSLQYFVDQSGAGRNKPFLKEIPVPRFHQIIKAFLETFSANMNI